MLILQLTHALVDGMQKLEEAYNKNKYIELEKAKKDLMEIQERLAKLLRE